MGAVDIGISPRTDNQLTNRSRAHPKYKTNYRIPLKAGQSRTLQATASGTQRLVLVLSSSNLRRNIDGPSLARTRAWSRYRELFSVDLEIAEGIEAVRVTVELDEEAKERLVDAAEVMDLLEEGK